MSAAAVSPEPVVQSICAGEWGVGGQNLTCSLRDLLFDTYLIAQVVRTQ
jgi:hypothetical protein